VEFVKVTDAPSENANPKSESGSFGFRASIFGFHSGGVRLLFVLDSGRRYANIIGD
jgi:hypothetical protein